MKVTKSVQHNTEGFAYKQASCHAAVLQTEGCQKPLSTLNHSGTKGSITVPRDLYKSTTKQQWR